MKKSSLDDGANLLAMFDTDADVNGKAKKLKSRSSQEPKTKE
jgi:hypothetical protein